MPDFGTPVAGGVKFDPNSGVQRLSDIMNLKRTQQALQSGALGIQQQQQNLERGAAETQMTQQSAAQRQGIANIDWSKYDDGTGTVSTDKMLADKGLQQAAGDQFLDLVKAGAAARAQQLQNKQLLVNLNDGLRSQFGSMVGALRTDPDVIADNATGRGKVADAMRQFAEAGGPDAARVANIYGQVVTHAPPGKLARGISAIQLQAMDASRQAGAQGPSFLNTGATNKQVNPLAAGGNLSGQDNIGNTLSPQLVMDAAGNPHFVGGSGGNGNGAGGGMEWTNRPGAEAQASAAQDMTNHFSTLNESAKSLPLVNSLTHTIEGLAPSAFTNVGGDKRQYLAGLANVFGINLTGDAKKDTDLLNKAMAQLNMSTPAATDAARTLVEAGQPNSKMDPEAIKEAAGTVASQVKMNVAERDFLNSTRFKNGGAGDTQTYQQARQWFENNADPRIWQYEQMRKQNPAGAKKFILRQPDAADLANKADVLQQAGFFK